MFPLFSIFPPKNITLIYKHTYISQFSVIKCIYFLPCRNFKKSGKSGNNPLTKSKNPWYINGLGAFPLLYAKVGKKRERLGINNQQSDGNQKGNFYGAKWFFKGLPISVNWQNSNRRIWRHCLLSDSVSTGVQRWRHSPAHGSFAGYQKQGAYLLSASRRTRKNIKAF